jgi:hypothetical protein
MQYDNQKHDQQRYPTEITPIYIRLPRSGKLCPYSGLTRSYMNYLTIPNKTNNFTPLVVSRIIKIPPSRRAVKLIDYASLMGFLRSAGQAGGEVGQG